jgi:carboxymethylenebutenolidase
MIEITSTDGHHLSAYRADPATPPKGAVVVIQEIFGVNAHIKKVADGFAAQGYTAIAPALFDRVRKDVALGYDESGVAEGLALMKQLDTDTTLGDIQSTVDTVTGTGKVAVVGYCWGGYLAYQAANQVKGLACAVGYYGGGIVDEWRGKRRIPTLLHFGAQDELIPLEYVKQFRANRPDVSVFDYPAGHGFNCDERPNYNADAAQLALERTLGWLSQFLVGQPPVTLKNAGAYAQSKTEKKKKKATASEDMGPPAN